MTTSTTVMDPIESIDTIPTICRREPAVRVVAPSRFDVHAVAEFEHWVTEQTNGGERDLVVDCSRIDFVDVAAIEAIERARADLDLELADLSVAARVTFRLLDLPFECSELPELAVAA